MLDRAEFVILQLLRMGKADLPTVALILNKFEEVVLAHSPLPPLPTLSVQVYDWARSIDGDRPRSPGQAGRPAYACCFLQERQRR